jgi:hypothetical protein
MTAAVALDPQEAVFQQSALQVILELRTGAPFGENYGRLVEVKNAWDPDNLFRLNMNVAPDS